MKFIKKLFAVIFNPFLVTINTTKSPAVSETFNKRGILIVLVSLVFTALILAFCWFMI